MNLIEGIQEQTKRCRELREIYAKISTGFFGMGVIDNAIKEGEAAIASGDVVRMLQIYKRLESIE